MCGNVEEYSVLKQACVELNKKEIEKYEQSNDYDYELSKRYKRKMNCICREKIGIEKALHPEVDNIFERIRSKIAIWWNNRKNNGED